MLPWKSLWAEAGKEKQTPDLQLLKMVLQRVKKWHWELKLCVLLAPWKTKQNKNPSTACNHYQKVVLEQVSGVLRAMRLLLR